MKRSKKVKYKMYVLRPRPQVVRAVQMSNGDYCVLDEIRDTNVVWGKFEFEGTYESLDALANKEGKKR